MIYQFYFDLKKINFNEKKILNLSQILTKK